MQIVFRVLRSYQDPLSPPAEDRALLTDFLCETPHILRVRRLREHA